mmetsp:Transcript_43268/g.142036  ORF Transcript_43268/g.142036 Transcript_43268/m.142036 type:complete len:247 (+) Transcript_43268:222-962(+)
MLGQKRDQIGAKWRLNPGEHGLGLVRVDRARVGRLFRGRVLLEDALRARLCHGDVDVLDAARLGSEERRRHRLGDDDRDAAVVSRHDSDLREGLHRRRLARDVAAARVNAVLERAGLANGREADGLGAGRIVDGECKAGRLGHGVERNARRNARKVDAGEGAGLALGRDVASAGVGGAGGAGAGADAILERDGLGVDADGVASARDDVGRVVRQRRLIVSKRGERRAELEHELVTGGRHELEFEHE